MFYLSDLVCAVNSALLHDYAASLLDFLALMSVDSVWEELRGRQLWGDWREIRVTAVSRTGR